MDMKRYRLKPGVLCWSKNGEESVICVHRARGDMDFFGVDSVGTFIVESMINGKSDADIIKSLKCVFKIGRQKAKEDLESFVSKLFRRKIVEEVIEGQPNEKKE
jgi:hypothetical protein